MATIRYLNYNSFCLSSKNKTLLLNLIFSWIIISEMDIITCHSGLHLHKLHSSHYCKSRSCFYKSYAVKDQTFLCGKSERPLLSKYLRRCSLLSFVRTFFHAFSSPLWITIVMAAMNIQHNHQSNLRSFSYKYDGKLV